MGTTPLQDANVPAITWSLTAIALALAVGRYIIRCVQTGKLHWDDLTHLIAMIALVAFSVLLEKYVKVHIRMLDIEETGKYPSAAMAILGRKYQTAFSICAWVSLWFVKFTFLLMYRLIFKVSPAFNKVWWAVMIFVAITFWAPIAGALTVCGPASQMFNLKECAKHTDYSVAMIIYSGVFQVVTDLMIMALPLWKLYQLQMKRGPKIGLGVVFCIAFVTVALEILRTVESVQILQQGIPGSTPQYAQVTVYATVEICLNAWIASVPVYKPLFDPKSKLRTWIRGCPLLENCPKCGAELYAKKRGRETGVSGATYVNGKGSQATETEKGHSRSGSSGRGHKRSLSTFRWKSQR